MPHRRVKGVILAGGQGKRLRPLSYYFQKCMIPVGPIQKPILEYIIRLFRHHDITDISLLVGYKHEQIVNYFNSGDRFGVRITYILDNDEFQGSGGSILNFHQNAPISTDDTLVIYYGDIISNIDLHQMLNEHHKNHADIALQLPTGSGKTLVGLLIAEWRRIKYRERVVYLCPTIQLVNQAVELSVGKYGINPLGFTGKQRKYSSFDIHTPGIL